MISSKSSEMSRMAAPSRRCSSSLLRTYSVAATSSPGGLSDHQGFGALSQHARQHYFLQVAPRQGLHAVLGGSLDLVFIDKPWA